MSFADFRAVYPRRKGHQPWHPAEKKYLTAIKNGADEAHIISSARRYAEELQAQGKIDTEFVCMAQTWLNQKRWLCYAPDTEDPIERQARMNADMAKRGYYWHETGEGKGFWEKTNGHSSYAD